MGYSGSSLAIKGKSPGEIQAILELAPTGERVELPLEGFAGATLEDGWYLIVSYRKESTTTESVMKALCSPGVELVTCYIEEHVMCSQSTGWANGNMQWSVTHDCQKAEDHLDIQGTPPPELKSIMDDLASENPDEDLAYYVFDIPVQLSQALTGYRYDEYLAESEEEPFEVLKPQAKAVSVFGINGGFKLP